MSDISALSQQNGTEIDSELDFELDPEAIALQRAEHFRRLHAVQVPAIRLIGFALLTVGVALHNHVFLGSVSWPEMLRFGLLVASYSLVSWLILLFGFEKVRWFHLGDLFLGLDIVFYILAIYYSGGNRSWLFFILLVRVADQVVSTVKRTLIFGHLIVTAYLLLIAYLVFFEHRQISWNAELAKAFFLYITAVYISTAARPSERRRRRAATAVRTARQLIDRLKDQSFQLNKARAQAEEASTAKSVFLSTMSHELRTPMTAVIGRSELLEKANLTREQRKHLDSLKTGAESLMKVLNDIIDFSALDMNRLNIAMVPFDLRYIINESMRPLADRARESGLAFAVEIDEHLPDRVFGDPARLRQTLIHLVDNAIKFTPKGKVGVVVSPTNGEDREHGVRFEINDSGVGFPIEQLDELFGPFVQADGSASRKFGGSGIGLAVSKALVELMGGHISATSAPHQGSRFWFELPLSSD